jgi:predicted N-formylglutamate amidohydrolase
VSGSLAPDEGTPLFGPRDPSPVRVINERGAANLVLVGDHAGNAIPSSLGDLGLSADDRTRHIAWDIGVQALGEELAVLLDATFIAQRFSRLVIDCNRDPRSTSAIVEVSDGTTIPGNAHLDEAKREERRRTIHEPYQQRIADEIAVRRARNALPVLVALHSFTPRLGAIGATRRPWPIGILHDAGDTRLCHAMLDLLRREPGLTVGDNEPYRMDGTDHTIPRHAYPSGALYLEVEFRQDLLADAAERSRWATRFASWLGQALVAVAAVPKRR